ncbi:hypothetical protein [Paracidovorax avenae]|uniref:hypothetical protein n=1 Tax=Paracidovorax avenae TaxID=80867 RepID=UPI001AD8292B|nr:hypothetical protein [Paracidovorax avenae]
MAKINRGSSMGRLISRLVRRVSGFILALALVGCVGTQQISLAAPDKSPSGKSGDVQPPAGGKPYIADLKLSPKGNQQTSPIDVTPWHDSKDHWTGPTSEGSNFAGAYTRLVVKSTFSDTSPQGGGADNRYKAPYQKRHLIERALVGKDFNVVLTAKMKIPNVVDISVPLAIIGHTSNSDGENWIREVYFERRDFPLFLVKKTGQASTPSVSAEIKGTSSITSRGVAAGVSALSRLASVAGATPALITTLNKESTKEASDKIDAEISKLLSSSVTERSSWDRPLSNWVKTDRQLAKGGIEVMFRLPSEGDWQDTRPIGSWMITFAPPRPSIFSDWYVCSDEGSGPQNYLRCSGSLADAIERVRAEVQPAEILSYKLLAGTSNLGSIHSFLKSKDWYTAGVTAMAKVLGSNAFDIAQDLAASEFCRHVITDVTELELNQTDAELVLWAVYKIGRPEFSVLNRSSDCETLMQLKKMPSAT